MNFQPLILVTRFGKLLDTEIISNLKLEYRLSEIELGKPEIIYVYKENKKSIGIKEVKQTLSALATYSDNLKLVVIQESDLLTIEAQNSLLKILEEPYSNTIFILVTNKLNLLNQTVISRCRIIFLEDEMKKNPEFQNITDLININLIERYAYLDKILDSENSKEELLHFIENLILYYLRTHLDMQIVSELKRVHKMVSSNKTNLKFISEYLNLFITKYI